MENKNSLLEILNIINNMEIKLNIEEYLKLLEDENVKKILASNFNSIKVIEQNKIDKMCFSDDNLISLVEAYCVSNNIDIILEEELNFENFNNKDCDIVKIYFNEVGKQPLLSKEQEQELFIKMKNGDKKSREKLISSNLRLVINIAKRYQGRGIEFLDLIEDGNIGLIRAIEKYDASRCLKLSTYATWWIRQSIVRNIADKSRIIRIPVQAIDTMSKIEKAEKMLKQNTSKNPSYQDLSEITGLEVGRIRQLKNASLAPVSLDMPVGEEEDNLLIDFIKDDNTIDPADYTDNNSIKEIIEESLSNFSERDENIIRLRWGLYDGKCRTLEEIGQIYNITRERVRQIEFKCLRALKCKFSREYRTSFEEYVEEMEKREKQFNKSLEIRKSERYFKI